MELKDSFKASGKKFDKVKTPEETLEWALKKFAGLGEAVLKDIRRIDKGRLGIPVYISEYGTKGSLITGNKKQMGKGITEAQAKASAVMELAERFSLFEYLNKAPFEIAPFVQVSDPKFKLDHHLLAIHHKRKLSEEERDFLLTFQQKWISGLYATKGIQAKIPFSWMWPINEYNGSAAGNSLEEASVQAICEVVERHVCSLISYNKLTTPTISINSIKDSELLKLIEKFKKLGCKLILKDFSLDIGIPTVGAIAWDPSTYPERSEIVYTAGTSTSPVRAAIRALTEVAQLAGDFDTDGKYLESGLPKFKTLDEANYVLESDRIVELDSLPDCSSDNFKQEVENLSQALQKVNMPVYLCDITHEELKIPAVYAIIPGNHFRDRTINIDLAFHLARLITTSDYIDQIPKFYLLDALNKIYKNRFDINFYLAHLYEELGDFEEAINHYKKALSFNPPKHELASILCNLGNCLRQMGKIDEAIEELKKAKMLEPTLKEIHNILGTCLYQKGLYMEAIECFETAIELDPNSAIDYANIGSNLRKLGLIPAAIKWYEMALELDPELEWARNHLMEIKNMK